MTLCIETRQEHYFEMLIAMLPASYKVVQFSPPK